MTDRDEHGESPLDEDLTYSPVPTSQAPGSRAVATIGPYRLLQQVGEGGMGVVWLAEQVRPVRRQVALKVIKLGMDTARVIARFEAERQALAIMEHPAVARVFDAGVTPEGRPYFAMEYVRGEAITAYCRRHLLSTNERIHLFMQVCDGVQHAHQKGIIHRDLKPSNILVTMQDGRAVPKIIDFGLAKATTHQLTEHTLFTELGTLIGTPEYMSPEQAELTGLDIDTRTDVYALGIILYELLTGVLPFEAKALREKGLDDIRRMIREVDSPRPSVRVATLAALEAPPANLRRDPVRLASQLRGDLDWITMKTLEKDRTRRYGSVSDLAADLRRHLDNLPVLASPPSTVYRVGRFMRRHRFGVAAAATLVVLLFAFAATMALQARRIAQQRDRALAAERQSVHEAELTRQVSTFLVDLFKVSDPSEARGNRITAREILDQGSTRITQELKDQPAVQGRLMATMGRVYLSLGLYDRARALVQDALAIRRRTWGEQHPEVAESLDDLGSLEFETGNLGEAERLLRDSLALRRRTLGDDHLDTASVANHLAMAIRRKETPEALAEAEQLFRSGLAARRRALGADDRAIAESLNDLGLLFAQNKRDYAAAEPLFREALTINRRAFGNEHVEVAITLNNLALLLRDTGRFSEAESLLREALVIHRRVLGEDHPGVVVVVNNLANVLQRKGDLTGAESIYRDALALQRKVFPDKPDEHWEVATIKSLLGGCLIAARRYADAEPLLLESYPIIKANFGEAHPRTQVALKRLVDLYDVWGKPAKETQYRAMLAQPTR